MALFVSLDALINSVQLAVPDDEPLARLEEAARMRDEIGEVSDALLGHFVDKARRGGCSWSQIGDALGVTKQAAQQRHTNRPVPGDRMTERAKRALELSQEAARRLGHTYVGTEHLLLGLLDLGSGLAQVVLAERGITGEQVEAHVIATTGRGSGEHVPVLPHTPRAARVLVGALYVALELGHNYIGTEHLLLALFREPEGIAAAFLTASGAGEDVLRPRLVEVLLEIAGAGGG